MANNTQQAIHRLKGVLKKHKALAIAVSGGVDSMTLAAVSHDVLGHSSLVIHAQSPAVPAEASERVREHANRFGWSTRFVDAGEFDDEHYRANPVNRCYYCKSNLYTRIQQVWQGKVASGANLDDLGDYRPGLLAASEKQITHPLIEAQIDKPMVRAIAKHMGLELVHDLPAQPCLSSRIETGIEIQADDLAFVHEMESYLTRKLGPGDIRCRITVNGVRIEVDASLQEENALHWDAICQEVTSIIHLDNRVLAGFSHYSRGSAFLTDNVRIVHS